MSSRPVRCDMRGVLVAILAIALLQFAVPAGAQDPTAPHPSPANNVLYAHHHDSDTAELNGWMNTLVVDSTGNDVALGPTAAGCCPQARVHALTLAPALAGDIVLDPSGNIVFEAYIGAGGSQGVVRVSTELRHGGELVAAGAAQNHVYQQAGTNAYPKLTWTVAPAITTLQQGKDLVWTISITGVAAQTVFISVSPERGSTNIALPILSTTAKEPSGTTYQNLTGAAPAFNVTATTPTNATHVYNWTGPATPLELRLDGNRSAGNATLILRDAANQTLANHTFSGAATVPVQGAAGNWTFILELRDFVGNITVQVQPASSSGPGTGNGTASASATHTSATSQTSGNATGNGGGPKGSPTVAPAVLTVTLLAVAVALRRRQTGAQ